jgi:hypothetical protein
VNSQEIEEVLEVPLSVLLDKSRFRQEIHKRDGKPFLINFYQHRDHTIWGATATILKQLLDLLPEKDKARIKRRHRRRP